MENEQNLTIKERREQKRQEKLLKKESSQEKETKKKMLLWPMVFVVLVVIVFGVVMLVKNPSGGVQVDIPVTILDSVNSSDWTRGNVNASTTLIEYGDFVCPACEQYYYVVKKLEGDFKDVRFVFRNFPLSSHANARIAARAAEASGVQGKFFEMHDLLYENQDAWATNGSAKDIFVTYAQSLGLNIEQFKKDFESKEIGLKIDEDLQTGNAYGVNGTPTFYLNNTKLSPKSYEELKKLISNEVSAKS